MSRATVVFFFLLTLTSWIPAKEHVVQSAIEITRVTNDLRPGDVVIMAKGIWQDQGIVFRAQGTVEKPIMLRAETPGEVILVNKSSLIIEGEYLVVSGLAVKNARSASAAIAVKGRRCRLTDTAVIDSTCKVFVHMFGIENRVDHCYFAGKTSESPTLQVEVEGQPNRHRIDRNHFGPRPPLRRNGGETIRVGYSHQSMTNSATVVEHNLFDRCDGEIEIISNKSCENVYRANTFLECAGMLTLRHGNRCLVEGNFFFGRHKPGSGGIRVMGEDHTIINNYIEGVEQGGFWITSGIVDSPLKGYFQARNCLIAFNTVVDSRGPAIELDAGLGRSRRTLRPENITIANNIFLLPQGAALLRGEDGEGFKWVGNVAWAPARELSIDRNGIKLIDPKLVTGLGGLSRPGPDSPMRGTRHQK